jgi:hypothetical protein
LARQLEPDLVAQSMSASSLASALQAGLSLAKGRRDEYARQAQELLEPYRFEPLVDVVRSVVLPALDVS